MCAGSYVGIFRALWESQVFTHKLNTPITAAEQISCGETFIGKYCLRMSYSIHILQSVCKTRPCRGNHYYTHTHRIPSATDNDLWTNICNEACGAIKNTHTQTLPSRCPVWAVIRTALSLLGRKSHECVCSFGLRVSDRWDPRNIYNGNRVTVVCASAIKWWLLSITTLCLNRFPTISIFCLVVSY